MKSKLLILITAILAVLLCFAACSPDTSNGDGDVASIEIVSGSVPTEVKVGDTPDFSQIKVKVNFKDGTSKEIGYSDVTISALDTSTAGKKTVTVTYSGATVKFDVLVVDPSANVTVTAIKIVPGSVDLAYYIGQTPDMSRLQVEATYSDGTIKLLSADQYTCSAVDTSTAGEVTFTVTYTADNTITDSVKVNVIGITSINVITNSIKNKINVGEALDTSSIEVLVEYSNGESVIAKAADLTLGTVDTATHGKKELSITYKGITVQYPVEVVGVESLTVVDNTVKKEILKGQALDVSGISVNVKYTDGSTDTLDAAALTLGSVDENTAGEQTLTVSYLDKTVNYTVKVCEIVSIRIEGVNNVVPAGEEIDISNMKVYGVYNDSAHTEIQLTDGTITTNVGDIDINTSEDKTLVVSYKGAYGEFTTNFKISATAPEFVGLDIRAYDKTIGLGGVYNNGSVVVYALYGNDTEKKITDFNISEVDTSAAGNITLTVSYTENGVTQTAEVTVEILAIQSLSVSGIASTVAKGGVLDTTGAKILVTFADGSTRIVNADDVTISAPDTSTGGNKELTVTYLGSTAKVAYYVKTIVSISALNNTVPATVLQGANVSYESMKLTVVYDNGDIYLVGIEDANLHITPETFDTSTAGAKAITFEYFGFTTSVNILVKGVQSVEVIGGILTQVNVGQKLDTSDILVRVMHTDGTYVYADINSPYLEVGSIDTSTEGTKTLVVKYQGIECTVSIEVVSVKIEGLIFGALLPDEIVARESYKKNFKDSNSAYRVGDDNPYYFYLNVIQLDENDDIIDVDGKSIPTSAKVYLVENGSESELTGDALTNMVEFNSAMNSYDFTDAAIGKTFRLEIRPADKNSYVDEKSVTKSHTVTVVDGYNIYEAWELNVITNVRYDIHDSFGEALDQYEVATSFLAKRGVTRPQNLAGVVLHGNIDVKVEDVPAEYFYEYEDANGVKQKGLYDFMSIFNLGLTMEQKTFNIYGNYYSIYSYNIPCVTPKGVANNTDEFSSAQLFKIKINDPNMGDDSNHVFAQVKSSIEAGNEKPFENFIANVQDLATRDNDPNSNDQSASERHMRGLTCYKVGLSVTNMTNVNIDAYMQSVCVEHSNSVLNLEKVKFYNAWQTHLYLWNYNRYQNWVYGDNIATKEFMQDLVVNINDSFIAKSGGPVILAQSGGIDQESNHGVGVDVNVTGNSELYSYVTGQEAWFVAVGQTQLAAQIKAMSALISGPGGPHGFTSMDKIQGVETLNMIMVNMGEGTSLGTDTFNGSFTNNGVNGLLMSRPDYNRPGTNPFQNPMLDMYGQLTNGVAPIFQTSAGGTAYTDGATGCYGIDFTTGNPYASPDASFYQGEYITLYYSGIGIMMEYYHK